MIVGGTVDSSLRLEVVATVFCSLPVCSIQFVNETFICVCVCFFLIFCTVHKLFYPNEHELESLRRTGRGL